MNRLLLAAAMLASGSAFAADNCTIELTADDMMKFDKSAVTVSAGCPTITLKLTHSGKLPAQSMGHNIVVSPTADYMAAAQEGMKAGLEGNYVKADDPRVLGHTKIIGGGETTTATFPGSKLKAGGDYTFYCSFPGHWAVMKGTVTVTP